MANQKTPAHLKSISPDGYWARLEIVFGSLSILFDMRFETETEAVGNEALNEAGERKWVSVAPQWDGVRSWLLLPYIHALEQQRLQEQFEVGRKLMPKIREHLEKRKVSPEFLDDWGRFRAAAGVLEFLYWSNTSIGHQRSAYAGGRRRKETSEAHKRWFSHYFLRKYKRGRRPQAEEAVTRLINAIVDGNIKLTAEHDVKWFEEFLQLDDRRSPDYSTLREAYKEDDLPIKHMKTLVAKGAEGIPPVDIEFPDP
ncbi:hypothetical protein [Sinorhizobium fredii]|uniref:hypothetical protein n=1 Tax=Rhizobium fredii TaxID=380 RepID=UPI00056A3910|nr:hypothetical protein [Sinorhizobium fredii]